jgi:hypothetical protein
VATKIRFDFDPEEETGIKIDPDKRDEALAKVADYVRDSVLSYCGDTTSPVAGEGSFPALSKAYKKKKAEISSSVEPNLELYGDMLDSVEVVQVKGKKLRIQVGTDQNDKADGHCNFSGKSKLPRRRFIPNGKEGQTFKRDIISGMRDILIEYEDGGDQ